MGRREAPVTNVSPELALFAEELRELRRRAGNPPYRRLAAATHYSVSTLSVAASGRGLPSRDVTLAFVRACGGDEEEWARRWAVTRAAVEDETGAGPAVDPAPTRRRIGWLVAGVAVVVLAVAGVLLLRPDSPPAEDPVDQAAAGSPNDTETETDPGDDPDAGVNCPGAEGHDNDRWHAEGGDGWREWAGPAVAGCAGVVPYTRVTGLAETWDEVFSWEHRTGTTEPVSCFVHVHVPEAPVTTGLAHYDVYGADEDFAARLGTFTVDQRADRGRWLRHGPFTTTDGVFGVDLNDRGTGDHHVLAGPVRITCDR